VAGGEGTAYQYYSDYSDLSSAETSADTNRIKYRNNAAQYWWLRSPTATDAYSVRNVFTTGGVYGNGANNSNGVAPACCIVLDDIDDWVKQTFYTEVDADLPAIETFKDTNTLDSTETLGEVTITQWYSTLQNEQGATTKTVDIYIGDSPLIEGETVSKTSTGIDIELFNGENTISTTLYNKPTMEIKPTNSTYNLIE
jgi:hypothetical protein